MPHNCDNLEHQIVRARRHRRLITLCFLALLLLAIVDMVLELGTDTGLVSLTSLQAPTGLYLAMISILVLFWRYARHIEQLALSEHESSHQALSQASTVLDSITDALICTDQNGLIIQVNHYGRQLLQENAGYHQGNDDLHTLWPHPKALWNQPFDRQQAEPQHAEHCIDAKLNQQSRQFEQQYQATFDRNGEHSGGVWWLKDITESLQAQRQVQESRHRYKALFDTAGVGHCVLDASCYQGDIDTLVMNGLNKQALELTGASSEEELRNGFPRLFQDQGQQLAETISRVLMHSEQQERCLTTTIQRFDQGGERDINLHFSDGWYGRVLVTMIDITESKRAHENLERQERYWRDVMTRMPVVVHIASFGSQGEPWVHYRNNSAAQFLGYTEPSPVSTQDWLMYGDEEFRTETFEMLQQLKHMPAGQTISNTGTFHRRGGDERVIHFEYTPFEIDRHTDEVQTFICIARDTTGDIIRHQQMLETTNRYRLLAEHMSDIVWATNTQLDFTFVSPSVESLLGYSPDEIRNGAGGDIFSRHSITPLLRQLHQHIQSANDAGTDFPALVLHHEITATAKTGERYDLDLRVSTIRDDQGNLQGLLGVCRDITDQLRSERELKQAATVFGNSNEAILITDHHGDIIKVNEAFYDLTGFADHDVINHNLIRFLAPGSLNHIRFQEISDTLRTDGYWQGEINYGCASGRIRNGWVGISLIRERHEKDQTFTVIISDITERRVIEESIHRLAYYDALTNLPNRSQMFERLESEVRQAAIKNTSGALLFIDLDRFKPINDSFGHQVGDQVLQEVASRLRQCVKARDLICRMGGDEFTSVLSFPGNVELAPANAERVAQRILKQLSAPYELEQRSVYLSASIGIALFPEDGQSANELLKNADMAMYHAKSSGRNNVQFFNDAMRQKAIRQLEMVNDLHQALPGKQFSVEFQPQFDCQSHRCTSVEALLRWHHPEKGKVNPAEFIPVLEETGLINAAGRWVLQQSCQQLATWRANGIELEHVAVNVSGAQFADPDFVLMVRDIALDAGIEPHQLELELTETILMEDADHTLQTLKSLRALGFRVAVDDFGTGYSSLQYLNSFPVDKLKIDQAFVHDLPTNSDSVQLVKTIITMAQNMKLNVVAEGVENCQQLDFLIQNGCDKVQGYLMARPTDATRITDQHPRYQLCCHPTPKPTLTPVSHQDDKFSLEP